MSIPLVFIFIGIIGIGSISSYFIRSSLINRMKVDGIELSNQVARQIESLAISINTINEMIEDNIRSVGKLIITNQDHIDNNDLDQIALDFNVREINVMDQGGKILFSNYEENIGQRIESNHPAYTFLTSEKKELMEGVRKSVSSQDYFKYGYVKNPQGGFVQVGVLANHVQNLSEKFSYQNLVEEIAADNHIVYALFIDTNLRAKAHSNRERIGIELTDQGSRTAIFSGESYAAEYYYEVEQITVYDVLVPVIVGGELIGAINLGLSMDMVYNAIYRNIFTIAILGILFFIILSISLFKLFNYREYAYKDILTGVNSRLFLDKWLKRNADQLEKESMASSIVMIDIDYFKYINDIYGHVIGDQVLVRIADILQGTIREGDFVIRYGGDEFILFLRRCDEIDAKTIVNRIQEKLKDIHEFDFEIQISYGIHEIKSKNEFFESITAADDKMYSFKRDNKDMVMTN